MKKYTYIINLYHTNNDKNENITCVFCASNKKQADRFTSQFISYCNTNENGFILGAEIVAVKIESLHTQTLADFLRG